MAPKRCAPSGRKPHNDLVWRDMVGDVHESVESRHRPLSRSNVSTPVAILLVAVVLLGIVTLSSATPPLVQRGIWLGAYAPPAPYGSMTAVTDLERAIGRRLDLVHIFKAWGDPWGAFDHSTVNELAAARSDGRRVLITWEPW